MLDKEQVTIDGILRKKEKSHINDKFFEPGKFDQNLFEQRSMKKAAFCATS